MADPKYADLPGIAYDQPDMYETSDLPESDQTSVYYEEESESIERLHISANDAYNKFRGKILNSEGIDFSDRVSKGSRIGYDSRSIDLNSCNENETPFQKYQRLKCEIEELKNEIYQMQETVKQTESEEQQKSYLTLGNNVDQIRQQLTEICLEETLGSELLHNLADPQGIQHKKLMVKLDNLSQIGMPDVPEKAEISKGNATMLYQLNFKPQQARLSQSSKLADLDQRLHNLESVVGATPEKMTSLMQDTHQSGLLEVAQNLSAKVNLLDNARLDLAETRLSALMSKLDLLCEKGATVGFNPDRDAKIAELHDLVKKSGDLSKVLPLVVDRMVALEALHQQVLDFSKSLTQLEVTQQEITANIKNNEDLVKKVQETFHQNLTSVKSNMESLDTRISALKKK